MKENNSPIENFKEEYDMFLQRQRMQQNKRNKGLTNSFFMNYDRLSYKED